MEEIQKSDDSKQFSLSKDEFQEYIETTLWSKFQSRLWKIVSVFLTIITVAGVFGIPYYISNEINKKLSKVEQEFSTKRKDILNNSKLLNLLSVLEERKKIELSNISLRLYNEIELLQERDSTIDSWTMEEITATLKMVAYEGKIYNLQAQDFRWIIDSTLLTTQVLPSQKIRVEAITPTGSTTAAFGHPFNDGTIGGILEDIKIRLSNLEVLREIIVEVELEMLAVGSKDELEEMQDKLLIKAAIDEKYISRYDTLLNKSLFKYFDKERLEEIKRYNHLYKLELKIEKATN